MEILQITANFPGKGNVNVLASPDLAGAKKMLDVDDDAFGNLGYRLGAAFLVPYPNRVRGKLSADGKTITTAWQGHTLTLPANFWGKLPGAEHNAMHGLILKARTDELRVEKLPGGEQVVGVIHAGNFGGHWLSKTDLVVTVTLSAEAVDASIVAHNIGSEAEPMAWPGILTSICPPATARRRGCGFPAQPRPRWTTTTTSSPPASCCRSKGTQYDLSAPGGTALGKNFYDDNWNHIEWKGGAATVEVIDPAAHYGVKIEGLSPEIKAIQMYAPPDEELCGHRAPVQLRRSLRQGVGLDGHRHGDAEAGREHQVARAAAGVCAVKEVKK